MDKQAQDKLWKELSEETKEEYRQKYKFHLADSKRDPKDNFGGGYDLTVLRSHTIVDELVNMFGTHNLNPKPQIKEWKDVPLRGEICDIKMGAHCFEIALLTSDFSKKLFHKIIATARIAKLIDLGYGGVVSEEEWKDDTFNKFSIEWDEEDNCPIIRCHCSRNWADFISFHEESQAEEFMSYESNKILVRQYYMM